MQNNLLFSIIIPTYNRANFIANTISSVLNQTYTNFEIIIVDDGSTDNTEEIIKNIKSDKLQYFKIPNSERAYARNYGVNKAKGRYVNFLDSDDLLYPNHLTEAISLINKWNNPAFFVLGYEFKDTFNNVTSTINNFKGDLNLQLLKKGNILSCNGVFIRQNVIIDNLFNEDRLLSASEDYELWLRISYKHHIYYSNIVTSSIINHDNRSVVNMKKEQLIIRIEKLIYYITNCNEFKKQYLQYKKFILANSYSYLSLHLSLTKTYKLSSLKYLLKSIIYNPNQIFTKRFLVILKYLLLKF